MNCYNSARYLPAALESVRAQTFTDWEIIFWDNRSTDESAAIFKSFVDPRFHYFLAAEHTILGMAKGVAIGKARGEWLAFLDCDDLWLPDKLEQQIAIISEEDPELGLVYGRMEVLVEDEARTTAMGRNALAANYGGSTKLLPQGNIFADLVKENFIPQPSALIRRSAYCATGGINPELIHAWDYDLFLRVSKEFRARTVQEVVCSYRIHGSNLSHAQAEDSYKEALAIVGRYLPSPEARLGMRSHQTSFAAHEIRQGRIVDGLRRLQMHGDILLFIRRSATFIWRRLYKFKSACKNNP
jgi:glycosyltransferase involved in cell wall biosynthesis